MSQRPYLLESKGKIWFLLLKICSTISLFECRVFVPRSVLAPDAARRFPGGSPSLSTTLLRRSFRPIFPHISHSKPVANHQNLSRFPILFPSRHAPLQMSIKSKEDQSHVRIRMCTGPGGSSPKKPDHEFRRSGVVFVDDLRRMCCRRYRPFCDRQSSTLAPLAFSWAGSCLTLTTSL
jgi:hypothetical protein